jgi:hypothetical protein
MSVHFKVHFSFLDSTGSTRLAELDVVLRAGRAGERLAATGAGAVGLAGHGRGGACVAGVSGRRGGRETDACLQFPTGASFTLRLAPAAEARLKKSRLA